MLEPGFGLTFGQLHTREGLVRLDAAFLAALRDAAPALADRLIDARSAVTGAATGSPDHCIDHPHRTSAAHALSERDEAELLIALGPHVDEFCARLFGIEQALAALRNTHSALDPMWQVKWKFVKRQAMVRVPAAEVAAFDGPGAERTLVGWMGEAAFSELAFARAVLAWQAAASDKGVENAADGGTDAVRRDDARRRLALALNYAAWAVHTEAGQLRHAQGVLFRLAQQVDPLAPAPHVHSAPEHGVTVHRIDARRLRRREGFALTDCGGGLPAALDAAHYCLLCHGQGTDSCSRGLREKQAGASERPPAFRRSAAGATLHGCPLEERISEFLSLKKSGHPIAALAMIAIDNPMMAATGHRICNDCMQSCIYQAQTPVDIPHAETQTLRDVLALPWGFEIYALLTRWNPLNLRRPLPKPSSGRTVLVAGMGPAGFTLAHHLLNEGHAVVGIDGLKIEPLAPALAGPGFEPVEDADALREPLESRVAGGFGGVAEYGITARWDKNFLTMVRLLLERRTAFALFGGVRLGGTLSIDDAFALGFDHVALAMGAGRPSVLDLPNGLARGVRTASDFLMSLQLTGAARPDSIASMQLRLPVVVIGGGLTAIDTATEALAYYPVQVEKFLARHEVLVHREGEEATRARWPEAERETALSFLAHARALRAERAAAAAEGRRPRIIELLQAWGGVTIAYRRRLIDSPAQALNREEIAKALEEGVRLAECIAPRHIEVDAQGDVRAIQFARQRRDEHGRWQDDPDVPWIEWPARTVLMAAGTQPNTVIAREAPESLAVDGRHLKVIDAQGQPVAVTAGDVKPDEAQVLTALRPDGRAVSFFGDMHPAWSGNVVKAMASARRGYPVISGLLSKRAPALDEPFEAFRARLDGLLSARIERVERLGPGIVEVVIRAPLAARRFQPGQFFRLQNFERDARCVTLEGHTTRLAMEGLALTGAWVDAKAGLVSTIVLEMGGSSDLCAQLRTGQPVVLMGPTGAPTQIPSGETVVLVGGGLGNAVLFSIGAACRAAGCSVLYFAGYRHAHDRFRIEDIEAAADAVVWCSDASPGFEPRRPQDRAFVGNVVQAMAAWGSGALGPQAVRLQDARRLIAIGSDRMMAAVAAARHHELAPYLSPAHIAIGSINSPMQCMLKEVCGQCLQVLHDPVTGQSRWVFSCAQQDQALDEVDFGVLDQRLRQNALQERQTAGWLALCRQP